MLLPSYFGSREYLEETIRRMQLSYFGLELDILKIIGALVLLIPAIPTMFKRMVLCWIWNTFALSKPSPFSY
ncbi:hypothetical protein [Flavobacterium sp.]|uniref:hypothetical protein n=1 Tax=Flavobacterium sp. TaxID=239 RepID=UPI0037C0C274